MSVTAGVIDAVIAVGDKLRGKIGQTKVKRYWPGKAPAWADDLDEVEDTRASKLAALEMDDRRMRRLAELRAENKAAARNDHKRKRQAEIISTIEEENDRQERAETEEEDEDAIAEKRLRVREKLLQREQEEAALLPIEEEEEEEESEYDTESEAEQQLGIAMAMPVFLPKPQRDTIAERERIEEEERRLEESAKKRSEEIKSETKQIVAEEIRKDEEIQKDLGAEASIADIDTDDDMDEAEDYEAWKTREIAVIKRQREEREARLKEKEEIEKVRDMAEEERKNQKKKWRFMQKYHHRGAFFQSDPDDIAATEAGTDDIFQRDFSAPTGEDKMNKSILPKIMQVKQFGRSGRTKWTHLVNEDTTDWNALWSMDGPLRSKYNAKMTEMIAPIKKPKRSRTMKDCEMK